jgi:xanthine dehydrogenase accessory factor
MSIRDIAADVDRWRGEGEDVALATVVRTWGSGPRGAGAKMAMTRDARLTGSVSGGCVESAVVEAGREVLETGKPKLLRFGVTDETAWDVGLSCGGTIEIFVQPLTDAIYEPLKSAFEEERAIAKATVIQGEPLGRTLIVDTDTSTSDDSAIAEAARRALDAGRSEQVALDDTEVFIDVELPPPVLVMVGGVHVAVALTSMADALGYRTVIVDPRGVFGSEERFPHAGELIREWPDKALKKMSINRSTAIATLTHDPKLDDPALEVALPSQAFYVGALGSKRTQEKRRRRLVERGLTEDELARLHAPIGLSIGSRSPEEIALSVMAQIVATRNGVTS